MNYIKKIVTLLIFLISSYNYGQLGFCNGSKGEAIFSENFGNGTNYGPALPAGITNYNFITGAPNDGQYTLFYRTNLYSTWHYSLDHTPDGTNGANGKALLVNANASTSGDFYKRTVSGLCVNTTFEFSAWLMNVYNPGSAFCGATEIPINVRFEIWNDTETVLLGSGNTGNIIGTATPIWQQFALVFTTTNQTSVVLKMKNNGLGGCGNDLAIDDIEFRSCGDLTTITSPSTTGSNFSTCNSPISIQLQANTTGTSSHFYQWQSSADNSTWTDIPGANLPTYTTPNLTTNTFYRTKVAQDIANLGNAFCSTLSDVFTVTFLTIPNSTLSTGDKTICSNESIPSLSVTSNATNTGVNWYDASSGGTLLQANSNSYTPTAAGTFYAETYDLTTNCKSTGRTPVTLTIVALPTATIMATSPICSNNTSTVSFSGTPNAIVNYTIDGGSSQTITLNSGGTANLTTANLTSNSTYALVNVVSPILGTCSTTVTDSATITVNPVPTATITGTSTICSNTNTTLTITGTTDAVVTYTIDNGPNQTVTLTSGQATITTPNLTTNSFYTLVSITSAGPNACTQSLTQVFTISIAALPTATITASSSNVCLNGSTTLNFSGTPNAVVTYAANGGMNQTITLNAAGLASVSTGNLAVDTTIQLISVALAGTSNCTQSLSDVVTIAINPTPTASYSGLTTYCSAETTAINLAANISGTTFTWTVTQNGTTGASAGSGTSINQMLFATTNDGIATFFVTPFFNGCAGAVLQIDVLVHPSPNPTIADGTICLNNSSTPSSQFYTLDTNLNPADFSFQWFFGTVPVATSGSTYNAYQIGTYSVLATNLSTGCSYSLVSAYVGETIQGQDLLLEQSPSFSENPTITVTVVGGNGPFLYQLDNLGFQSSNVFTNVSSGNHIVSVVDATFCTNLFENVTVINYPHFFTPNNDGVNDSWNIIGLRDSANVLIFDRYGKFIKQIKTNGAGWDGTYNGAMLFSDDYWFTIDYLDNGSPRNFKAHFALKR